MAKYLFLKHYRGAPAAVNDVPMDQWTPHEVDAHVQYMNDFADKLRDTGEFVGSQALSSEGAFVRYDGPGKPPVTDGPFPETKDLIAGWWWSMSTTTTGLSNLPRRCRPHREPVAIPSTNGSRCGRSWGCPRR